MRTGTGGEAAIRRAYRRLMGRLVADAARHRDVDWLLSPTGQMALEAMECTPQAIDRIIEAACREKGPATRKGRTT